MHWNDAARLSANGWAVRLDDREHTIRRHVDGSAEDIGSSGKWKLYGKVPEELLEGFDDWKPESVLQGKFVVHTVMLEPPEKCCHGIVWKPLSEDTCLVCTCPTMFDGCPTRCMTPMVDHKGPVEGCEACDALREAV